MIKFSIVSSIIAVTGSPFGGPTLTDKGQSFALWAVICKHDDSTFVVDWNPITLEQAVDPSADPFTVYGAEKTLAEHAVWEFAEKHPEADILTGG